LEPVIGIDLGTTNSVVATVRGNRVEVIPDLQGHRLHPSVVTFTPGGDILVGYAARARRHLDPQHTIYSAKRLIGQSMRNPVVQLTLQTLPYQIEGGPNEQALVVVRGRQYTIPEISAYVLMHLKQCAERHLGTTVTKAVITVPANFTDAQRQATKHAGELAGLKVLRILNEPTAAALAYGFGKALDARLAIYDLGGGTFDVTVLSIRDKIFEVLSTGGDSFLGGDDFDRVLVEMLAAQLLQEKRVDVRAYPEGWAKLFIASEQIKCQLSRDEAVAGTIHDILVGGDSRPVSLDFEITRAQFEAMISPYIERSLLACDEVLVASGQGAAGLTELILVGGSTRTPLVRRRITEHFRREPQTRINPDETVAYGAALQGAALTAGAHNPAEFYSLLLDVAPRALGIAVAGGFAEPIIEKNSPIPVERVRSFVTSHDNQTIVVIQVCQGESRRFAENAPLGTLTLEGIPPRARGDAEIEVAFTVDTDGILNVRARDVKSNLATQARIQVLGAPERRGEPSSPHVPAVAQAPPPRA
jgi:molecular chaperone DnaK